MSTTTWPAQGTTLAIDETGTGTYSLINNIRSITNLGGGSNAQADTTVLASTVKTFRQTIPDNGEVGVDLNWDPTDTVHRMIRDLKDTAGSGPNNFKATYNTGSTTSTEVFAANVSEVSGADATGPEENLEASLTLKVTGASTPTPT